VRYLLESLDLRFQSASLPERHQSADNCFKKMLLYVFDPITGNRDWYIDR